ncbi:YdcH family protein [Oceanibacterium hippocampi]|uniref:DUF465 domain-containing protein n=1 Tax=Oceanibacterium hippocampi TaxID=745714 RepID=A0A1Y5SDT9_9PROT|nr:DUF465 domain-containing protein [Oceanibacterium hippocampi]SLN35689.1 hypothetical protein OCH7691_01429 [Oceanibacterium hippocampi]
MTDISDPEELQSALMKLRMEHGDLDAAIDAMATGTSFDRLQIQRLKKRKLVLKDQIAKLESSLLPDIIA